MIPIHLLKDVTVVYTHAHCPDGLASAMILKDAFSMLGMNPRIEFLTHGTEEHRHAPWFGWVQIEEEKYALFCDIAPVRGGHPRTIVLDHHVGTKEIVESFGSLGVYADAEKEPGVSGAVLAFHEVWEPIWKAHRPEGLGQHGEVNDFAECVGVRDTWQMKEPRFQRGQYISKFLMSKPAAWWLTDELHHSAKAAPRNHPPYLTDEEIQIGRALFEAHEEAVRQAVEQCVHLDAGTARLIVFQEQAAGFRLCSDVAESFRLKWRGGDPWAVVAGFAYVVDKPGGEPRLVYSLRGLGGFDVCAFAKVLGGGGHTAAAGFSVASIAPNNPYEFVRDALVAFLKDAK